MRIRRLTAGLALTAAMLAVLPAGSAVALTATRGDMGDAVLAPAPSRTPVGTKPVTTLPAPSLIKSMSVSANSVIGTANVQTFVSGLITVKWGDGTRSVYDPSSPFPQNGITANSTTDVTFKHEYAVGNGSQVNYIVTAIVESGGKSDTDSRSLTVTPRWLVSAFQQSFIATHCDTAVEEYTEWSVNRSLSGVAAGHWRFDTKTNEFPGAHIGDRTVTRPLENSIINREMTMADPVLVVAYSAEELDEFFNDQLGSRSTDLHPANPAQGIILHLSGDDCTAEVRFDTDVRLLKPGAPQGGVFSGGGGEVGPIT